MKLGLALSGGGIRGIAHAGVVKALEENNIKVDIREVNEYIFTNKIPEQVRNKKFYIDIISVGKAVRASSSLPVVFSPCDFKNHKFLDGGTLNNVPAIQVRKLGADKVISINFQADEIDEESNIMDIVM